MPRELHEPPHGCGRVDSDCQYPKSVAMSEREGWIALREFSPELPRPEPSLAHVGIVEKDHGALTQLGKPNIEVVLDGVVSV